MLSKLAATGVKHFGIDLNELPKLSDLKGIENAVFIFDDLERCNIEINQVLGFMNNLTEHNHLKVIFVANEKEIGLAGATSDLPQRYMVALDKRLKLKEEKENKDDNKNEQMDKAELISRTNKIHSTSQYPKTRQLLTLFHPNMAIIVSYQEGKNDILIL